MKFKLFIVMTLFYSISYGGTSNMESTNDKKDLVCSIKIAKVKDFQKINVREIQDANSKMVIVNGITNSLRTGFTVYESMSKKNQNEVNIEVILNRANCEKEEPWIFEEIITLDDNIDKITFGKERDIIWDRNTYIHKEHIFMKDGTIELNSEDMDDITLQLKDIAFKEVKNRNLKLEKYIYVYFSEITKENGNAVYIVSFSSVDPDLYPNHKGNLSKEYPNFSVHINKESLEVDGLYYSK